MDLDLCPHCGGNARIWDASKLYWVECDECGCKTRKYMKPEDAAERWNARVLPLEVGFYDKEEIFNNCTVQVLENSVTGQTSIGWWRE